MTINEPVLLALETSTNACSAALSLKGSSVQKIEVGNNLHSKRLLNMVDDLLQEADIELCMLDAVVVGQGPGSFTGLRIGVGVGQGLAFGANKPMIGVSSIDAIAGSLTHLVSDGQTVLVAMDARMNEVYWAEYRLLGSSLRRCSNISVSPPDRIQLNEAPFVIAGNAFAEYASRFDPKIFDRCPASKLDLPEAAMLFQSAANAFNNGEFCSAAEFTPLYVRNDVAKKSVKSRLRSST